MWLIQVVRHVPHFTTFCVHAVVIAPDIFMGAMGCTLDYMLYVLHMQLSLPVLKSLRRPLLKHVCHDDGNDTVSP